MNGNTMKYIRNCIVRTCKYTIRVSLVFSFFCIFAGMVLLASCKMKNKDGLFFDRITKVSGTISEDVKFPVFVTIANDSLDFLTRSYVAQGEGVKDLTYYIKNEVEDTIFIESTSYYYDNYISGKRFKVPSTVYEDFTNYRGLLNLKLDVVNNTSTTLDIEELDVKVAKSELDSFPLIYIFTALDQSNSISFVNESWYNWKGFTFSYSLLKEGEVFQGSYNGKKHINYFKEDTTINLLPDLLKSGYNFKEVCKRYDHQQCVENQDFSYADYARICKSSYNYKRPIDREKRSRYECICLWYNVEDYKDRCLEISNLFHPYSIVNYNGNYEGRARLFGKISFDNSDYCIEFEADIVLSHECGFGAWCFENDKFDVKLHVPDSNYTLRYPYTTVIEPYGTELITLTIDAPKSSNHVFYVFLKNGNNLQIRSKNIQLHYLAPPYHYINN